MKKLFILFTAFVLAVPVFAQTEAQIKSKLEEKLSQNIQPTAENVIATFETFKKDSFEKNYYDFDELFGLMENTRKIYMKFRENRTTHPEQVKETAIYLSQTITIAKGDMHIRLPQYIDMEEPGPQLQAFGKALQEDARLAVKIRSSQTALKKPAPDAGLTAQAKAQVAKLLETEKACAKQIKENAIYPSDEHDVKTASLIFEKFMPVMTGYNQLREDNLIAARAAGKQIVKEKFVTKDGKSFDIMGFMEIYLEALPDDLYDTVSEFEHNLFGDVVIAQE